MAVKVIVEGNLGDEFAFNHEAKKVELKVDGTTVKKKPDGTVYAVQGAGAGTVEIEEVVLQGYADSMGNFADAPFQLSKDGTNYPINKVGRIKGTDWLVLQASGLFVQPQPPEQPPVYKQLTITSSNQLYNKEGPGYPGLTFRFDMGFIGFTPDDVQTVKYTGVVGDNKQAFEIPYQGSLVEADLSAFPDVGAVLYGVESVSVVLKDGTEVNAVTILPKAFITEIPD